MNSHVSIITLVPSAGPIPVRVAIQAKSLSPARSSNDVPARRENCDQPGTNWLVTEDEYFPFDADSFEER